MGRIRADVTASVKSWWRSPSAVFFTLVFPIILMTVFGILFSPGDARLAVAVQDNDGTDASRQLLAAFNQTGALEVRFIPPGTDAAAAAREHEHHTTLVIPAGYGQNLAQRRATELQLFTDPSRTQSRTAESIVRAVLQEVNLRATGSPQRVTVAAQELDLAGGGRYIDFFLPGVLGMTVMTNAVMGGLEVSAKLKRAGILRKIATTPIRKWEWVLAKVTYQTFIAGLSAVIILLVGVLGFGVEVRLGWELPVLIALSAALFAGIAMIMSRWVKEEDQANAAGSAVTFPMMFLAGTFFPLESMPTFLQAFARVLPLTYVNEAFRAAMITANEAAFALNFGVLVVLAAVAVAGGSLLVNWKEV